MEVDTAAMPEKETQPSPVSAPSRPQRLLNRDQPARSRAWVPVVLVAVVAALACGAIAGGYFWGRSTVPTPTQAEVDASSTQLIGARLSSATGPDGKVEVAASSLAVNPQAASSMAATMAAATGSGSLSFSGAQLQTSPDAVTLTGSSQLYGQAMTSVARISVVRGESNVIVEHTPVGALDLSSMVPPGSSRVPAVVDGKTVLVYSSHARSYTFGAGSPLEGRTVELVPGLHVVGSTRVSSYPELRTMLSSTTPVAPARRLSASWYETFEAKLQGVLRPSMNVSADLGTLQVNSNLVLQHTTVHLPTGNATHTSITVSATATTSDVPGSPVFTVSGTLTNQSAHIEGVGTTWKLGSSANPVVLSEPRVTIDVTNAASAPVTTVTLSGSLAFSGVAANLQTTLPLSSSGGSFALAASGIKLSHDISLSASVSFTDSSVSVSGTASIFTGLSTPKVTVSVTGSISQSASETTYSLTGTTSHLTLAQFGSKTLEATSLSFSVAGKISTEASVPTASLSGDATLGADSFTLSLQLPSPIAASTKFTLSASGPISVSSMMDAVCGSCGSVPATIVDTVKATTLQSASISVSTQPTVLKLTGDVSFAPKAGAAPHTFAVTFLGRQDASGTWGYGVGLDMNAGFDFSALVPGTTGFDTMPFLSGTFVVADVSMPFTFGTSAPLTVSKGVAFAAKLASSEISQHFISDGAWTHAETLDVSGSYASSANTMKLSVVLPENLSVTSDVTLSSGSVTIASTAPQLSLAATAKVTYSSTESPLTAAVTGTLGGSTFDLDGSISDWHIAAEHLGVTVDSATLKLHGTKTASKWSVAGEVTGDIAFGSEGMLEASIALPIEEDHLDIQVPTLRLSEGVVITDVKVDSTAGPPVSYSFSGRANVTVGDSEFLGFDVTGSISANQVSVSGSIPTWDIGGTGGLRCSSVDFSMSGTAGSQSATHFTGKLSGDVEFFGVSSTFAADLPLAQKGKLQLTVADVHLGSNVELKSVAVTVDEAASPRYALAASAVIGTGMSSDAMTVSVTGSLDPSTASFAFDGTLANFNIDNGFALQTLSVNMNGTKTSMHGNLAAKMTIDTVTVDVEAVLPDTSLTVTFPSIRVNSELLLTDVSLTAAQSGFSVAANAEVTTHLPSSPFKLSVTGSIASNKIELDGDITNWSIEVGKDNLVATNVHLAVTTVGSTFTGSLSGDVALGSIATKMSIALPAPTGKGLEIQLAVQGGHQVTVAGIVDATCGSGTAAAVKAPSSVSSVTSQEVTSASVTLYTKPAQVIVTGSVSAFSKGSLDMRLVVAKDSTGTWGFGVGLAIGQSFKVSDLVPSATAWDFLAFAKGGVVVSTSAQEFTMPSNLGTVAATDGVTIDADIPLATLSAEIDSLHKWPANQDVDVKGSFTTTTDALKFSATLPANLVLSPEVTISSATVAIASTEPKFVLDASASITVHPTLAPVAATADISVSADNVFHIEATAEDYKLTIGHEGVDVTAVKISLDDSTGSLSGSLSGSAKFSDGLTLGLALQVPTPGASGITFQLSLEQGAKMTAKQLIDTTCGTTAVAGLSVPSDFQSVVNAQFLSASITLTTSPWSFSATGKMSLFQINDLLDVELQIKQVTSDWHFGLAVGLGPSFTLGKVLPSKANSAIDAFNLGDGALVVSTFPTAFSFNIPNANTAVSTTDGVALAASISLNQGKLAVLSKWTKIDSLTVKTSFGFDTDQFTLSAAVNTDWTIADVVTVTQASLFMNVGGSLGLDIGVGGKLTAKVGSDSLDFSGKLMFSADSVVADAAMTTPWVNPLGVKGITIGDTELELGISYALVPSLIGFSGSLTVDGMTGSATVFVDIADPSNLVIAGSLPSMHMSGLLSAFSDKPLPAAIEDTIGDVGFDSLAMELNLGLTPLTFNKITFEPGFMFKVQNLMLPFFGELEKSTAGSRRLVEVPARQLLGLFEGAGGECDKPLAPLAGSSSGSSAGSSTGSGVGSGSSAGSSTGSGSSTSSGSSTGSGASSTGSSSSGTTSTGSSGSAASSAAASAAGSAAGSVPGTTAGSVSPGATGAAAGTPSAVFPGQPGALRGISADIQISKETGVSVNASMAPLQWGTIFSLSGANGPNSPAQLSIQIGDALADDEVKLSGAASLLDLVELSCYLDISDSGFVAKTSFKEAILDIVFDLSYEKGKTAAKDLSLYADINIGMSKNITDEIISRLTGIKNTIDSKLSAAQADVNTWAQTEQPKLTANQAEIASIKAKDQAAFSGVQKTLYDAQQTVASAEGKVNSLQQSIDSDNADREDCSDWYDAECKTHNAWIDTKIAALWTAMHAADAALWTAQEALKAAEAAVKAAGDVAPDLDPRVLALETEDATIETAKSVADAALSAAQSMVNGATDLVNWSLADMSSAASIASAFIKADSMQGVKAGAQLELGVSATILGKPRSLTLSLDFPPSADNIVSSVWDSLKSDVGL